MRYEEDCEMRNNGDGITPLYQNREAIRNLALTNLKKNTPAGKLGGLRNLQYFNFRMSDISTGTQAYIEQSYNTITDYPANITDCVMFGSNSINGQALYYNIVSINIFSDSVFGTGAQFMRNPSQVTFYLVQNIPNSTTSLGTKIPQPAPLNGTSSGTIVFGTTGAINGNQRVSVDIVGEQGAYYQNNDLKGIRCSGLALSSIFVQFDSAVNTAGVNLAVEVGVDVSSVSTSY